jgi:16S rRNA (cytosine967-C5)-methyltransferase
MKAAPTAREIAYPILLRVDASGAYAGLLLRRMPDSMATRDRALATELVLGTLRWQGRIDFALGQVASRSLAAIDPPLRAALRLGAHQILNLDRIPSAVAVNESVRIARRVAGRSGGGFVNAVLRRLCSSEIRWPSTDAPMALRLSVTHSHPEWLVRRWLARFGPAETEALLSANNLPAPVSLRVNGLRTDAAALGERLRREGIATEPGRFAAGALRVVGGNAAGTRAFRDGGFYLQDEASQLVASLLPEAGVTRVADLCAAPGGKALEIGARGARGGWVLASDRSVARLGLVRANAARLGLESLRFAVQDAVRPALRAGSLDAVLVDAPCSGTGILRRQPEIRWRRVESDLARLARTQAAILAAAAPLVRDGGALVYSVCSLEPEEGADQVAAFLTAHPRFSTEAPPAPPGGPPPELLRRDARGSHLWTLPHLHDLDGFFAVLLRRSG